MADFAQQRIYLDSTAMRCNLLRNPIDNPFHLSMPLPCDCNGHQEQQKMPNKTPLLDRLQLRSFTSTTTHARRRQGSTLGELKSKEELSLDNVLQMPHNTRMKTSAIHSRIQPEIKEQAETILHRLGLSPTEAIRMFYTQIALRNGLPFDVAIPNEETVQALEDSRAGRNLERFDSVEGIFESWKA